VFERVLRIEPSAAVNVRAAFRIPLPAAVSTLPLMLTGAAVGAFDVIAQGENCVTLLYSTQFCVVFLLLTPSAVQLVPLCLQKRRHQRRHPLSKPYLPDSQAHCVYSMAQKRLSPR
jgi:hypothetical protein